MIQKEFLTDLFHQAVAAADPRHILAQALPERPKGRTVVIALGKGAAQLAAAFEDLWEGPVEGVVVTRYGYAAPCKHLPVMEAAHPVPDPAGLAASEAVFQAVSGLTEDDLVVALVCGGGSALLPAPAEGLTLDDEVALNKALLASGAPIGVMNAIRKPVSRIKGGRLALACAPAKVVSLVVSDVPRDDPAEVASGPTVADGASAARALELAAQWRIDLPPAIRAHLEAAPEAPLMPDDPRLARNETHVIASAKQSLEAAAAWAEAQGTKTRILSDSIEGEAHDVGLVHAALAREVALENRPFTAPVLLLSGGETSVTLHGTPGRGGRNTAFLLAFAQEIDGITGIQALAADTDGIDGSQDNAGAFADGGSVARLRDQGLLAADYISAQDPFGAFEALGDLFTPGPTGTNVNDFRAILITPQV